jgi:hypothetical protein
MAACAAFYTESRMRFVDPTKPYRKSGGWGTRLSVVRPAVPNTNRGLIEELFLLRKPHEVRLTPQRSTENPGGDF